MDRIEVAHVHAPYRLHHLRDAGRARRSREEVHVIGHEHVSMDRHVMAKRRMAGARNVESEVVAAKKRSGPIVAPLNHVQRNAR